MKNDAIIKIFNNIVNLRDTAIKIMNTDSLNKEYKFIFKKGIEDSQAIISFIKNNYNIDDKFKLLLNDIDLYIDVNDENFSLSADIVDLFVKASEYIKASNIKSKENILILLLTALDVLD